MVLRSYFSNRSSCFERCSRIMPEATFKIFRGDNEGGELIEYKVPIAPGMVVLDATAPYSGASGPDLAVRWNCKAGRCGSCSAEVNGRPRLTCKMRLDALPPRRTDHCTADACLPVIKDLVTDVSWNYRVNQRSRRSLRKQMSPGR